MKKIHLPFSLRAKQATNTVAKQLFQIMEEKKSNLAVGIDVTDKDHFLTLAEELGDEICVLKTHIDLIRGFDRSFIETLTEISRRKGFLLFEDRKFADIGHISMLQYEGGTFQICNWSQMASAHILPGPGIVSGLRKIGQPLGRGLILIAQMNHKHNLLSSAYTHRAIEIAQSFSDFVFGFMCSQKITDDPRFIHFTTGVRREGGEDGFGRTYQTPKRVIEILGSDIIVVGRGITQAKSPKEEARLYKEEAYDAYQKSLCLQTSPS